MVTVTVHNDHVEQYIEDESAQASVPINDMLFLSTIILHMCNNSSLTHKHSEDKMST